jgi:hypothetical protein
MHRKVLLHVSMYLHHLQGDFSCMRLSYDIGRVKNFSVYEKRLSEDNVNISKHVGILYDTDFVVKIL